MFKCQAIYAGVLMGILMLAAPTADAARSPIPPDELDAIRQDCRGQHPSPGACAQCVLEEVKGRVSVGGISPAVGAAIVAYFMKNECTDRCVSNSCDLQGVACGPTSDFCG